MHLDKVKAEVKAEMDRLDRERARIMARLVELSTKRATHAEMENLLKATDRLEQELGRLRATWLQAQN